MPRLWDMLAAAEVPQPNHLAPDLRMNIHQLYPSGQALKTVRKHLETKGIIRDHQKYSIYVHLREDCQGAWRYIIPPQKRAPTHSKSGMKKKAIGNSFKGFWSKHQPIFWLGQLISWDIKASKRDPKISLLAQPPRWIQWPRPGGRSFPFDLSFNLTLYGCLTVKQRVIASFETHDVFTGYGVGIVSDNEKHQWCHILNIELTKKCICQMESRNLWTLKASLSSTFGSQLGKHTTPENVMPCNCSHGN